MGDAAMDGLSDRGSTPLRSISQRRAKNPGKADIWLVPGIFLLAGNVGYQGLQGCSDNMKGGVAKSSIMDD